MSKELDTTENPEDNPRIRRIIWKGLGSKSTREMASETGLTIEQVQRVKVSLIDEVDILTVAQMRVKILSDFQEFARIAREDYDNVEERNKAGLLNSATSALDKALKEINRVNKGEQEQINKLNQKRISALVQLMQNTVELGVAKLAEEYQMDEQRVFDIFNLALREATEQLQEDQE